MNDKEVGIEHIGEVELWYLLEIGLRGVYIYGATTTRTHTLPRAARRRRKRQTNANRRQRAR